MGEIKFRGKRIDNGEWVYGYYSRCIEKDRTILEYISDINGNLHLIQKDTVGQYTGVEDKNNKESYYGDILKEPIPKWYDDKEKEKLRNKKSYCLVKQETNNVNMYLKYNFNIRGYWETNNLPLDRIKTLEVVGNIYDNKELLEVYNEL